MIKLYVKSKIKSLMCKHNFVEVGKWHIQKWILSIHPVYKYSYTQYNCKHCGKVVKKKYLDPRFMAEKLKRKLS